MKKLHIKLNNFSAIVLAALLTSALLLSFIVAPLVKAQDQVLWQGWTRSKNLTTGQTEFQDVTNASAGDEVQVMLWHHNRENPTEGPLAQNVAVKFALPSSEGTSHVITGTSSADNAPTITDTTTINTSPESTKVKYIAGSAKFRYNKGAADGKVECETGFDYPPAHCYVTVSLPDSVVTSGVNLDTIRGGPLRGCNAHHETVTIKVTLKKKEEPTKKPPVCKLLTAVVTDRRVRVNVDYIENDGDVTGVHVDFGDGTTRVVTDFPTEHTYAQPGNYTIRATVLSDMGEFTSVDCETRVAVEKEEVPERPERPDRPVSLPVTGPASMFGLFAATSAAGSIAYRIVLGRRGY